MIRANKLRIGTTVRVRGYAVRVCSVTKKKIGYHRPIPCSGIKYDGIGYTITTDSLEIEKNKLTFVRLSEVEPIPLDVKYFEALGYEHTVWESKRNQQQDILDELGPLVELRSPDHRVVVNNMSNRQPPYDWRVHVDNERFESIGWLDVAYVHEFQGFLIDNDITQ